MWHFNGASSTGLAHSHSEGLGETGRWADLEVTEEPPHLLKQDAPTQEFVLVHKEHLPHLYLYTKSIFHSFQTETEGVGCLIGEILLPVTCLHPHPMSQNSGKGIRNPGSWLK